MWAGLEGPTALRRPRHSWSSGRADGRSCYVATHLRVPADTIRVQLEQAIAVASDIQAPDGDVKVFSSAYQTWDKRNEIMLEQAFSADGWLDSTPKSEYANAFGLQYPLGIEFADEVTADGLASDLASKVDRLQRICDTLDAYGDSTVTIPQPTASAPAEESAEAATIFVVHGRSDAPRLEVELLIHRATNLAPVVLAAQPNQGATIIEKLEAHLSPSASSFAVILMTGDDLGRLNEDGEVDRTRARQNVVLELGFAMGVLGRRRVAILHEAGVELPSDIKGVAYYPLDAAGAWKASLLGELRAAGVHVDAAALL